MIIRLSQKLATKIDVGTLRALPLDDNPLADWSADLFVASRTQYIIVTNTKSLYSAIMFGGRNTSDSYFIERALASIRDRMESDGLEFIYQRCIAPASATVSFCKALNRIVTGSMNELIREAKHWLADDDMSPHDAAAKLNDTLLSAIESSRTGYGKPHEALRGLVKNLPQH